MISLVFDCAVYVGLVLAAGWPRVRALGKLRSYRRSCWRSAARALGFEEVPGDTFVMTRGGLLVVLSLPVAGAVCVRLRVLGVALGRALPSSPEWPAQEVRGEWLVELDGTRERAALPSFESWLRGLDARGPMTDGYREPARTSGPQGSAVNQRQATFLCGSRTV